MELRQLEHFVAVAEEGIFARAAVRCGIAPSALSASIRALEQDLDAQLFSRTTRRVALTDAGRALLPEARNALAAAVVARAAVGDVRAVLRGSLVVGGIPTSGLLDQAAVLQRFAARFPQVDVRYTRDTSDALLDAVRQRRLDLAIVSLPASAPAGVGVRELARGRVMLACRSDHAFAVRPAVSAREVGGERFVVAGRPGSRGHDYLRRIVATADLPGATPHEVADVPTMLDFVERGLGVALVVDRMITDRPALRAVPIDDSTLTWTLGAVTPSPTSSAALELLTMIS